MNQLDALAKLQGLGQRFFETKDVAALLNAEESSATMIATRLTRAGFIIKLARGKWAFRRGLNALAVPEHLTAPFPSYVSLQSALYYHGIVSQIPAVTYAVSVGRTRRYDTPVGTFSIHHANPEFFFGFDLDRSGESKIALPEKALVDLFYFRPTRTRFFSALPELEIPKSFSWDKAFDMAGKIKGRARRTFVERALLSLRNSAKRRKQRR